MASLRFLRFRLLPVAAWLGGLLLAAVAACAAAPAFTVDAAFPGGNILVEGIDGDHITVRQDLRDTQGDWFYWAFRVRGAEGRTLRFTMATNKFTVRGPAVSTDAGRTWRWLGGEAVKDRTFSFTFGAEDRDVRFSLGMPYTEENLRRFLDTCPAGTALESRALCRTAKGRTAEYLRFGKLQGEPRHRILLTARHHACEMMANYELEGIVQAVLADDATGRWFREHVEVRAVPFMDKDGVEDGDQGKNRRPHDHNRDYQGEPIHPTVAAVKQMVPQWAGGKLAVALDLHCPAHRGRGHEEIHFVGGPEADFWRRVTQLSAILERETAAGPLVFRERDNLPFGKGWNTVQNGGARSFASWARTVPGVQVATTIELPYAMSSGQEVNAETARAFGRALAAALRTYLMTEVDGR